MRMVAIATMLVVMSVPLLAGDVEVRKLQGEVQVRHGVAEQWMPVRTGDTFGPDATLRTMENGSVTLAVTKRETQVLFQVPGGVIVDLSDVRELSQEELMLKLTMQRIRSSSYEWKHNQFLLPNTTVVHGTATASDGTLEENDPAEGAMLMKGTQVLFNHGFYSTCALKALEVMRRFPALGGVFENRWLAAEALERAGLTREALQEYIALASAPGLTSPQQSAVQAKIALLRGKAEQNDAR